MLNSGSSRVTTPRKTSIPVIGELPRIAERSSSVADTDCAASGWVSRERPEDDLRL
jgi:hypothetical protein